MGRAQCLHNCHPQNRFDVLLTESRNADDQLYDLALIAPGDTVGVSQGERAGRGQRRKRRGSGHRGKSPVLRQNPAGEEEHHHRQAGVLAEEFQQEGGDKEADCGGNGNARNIGKISAAEAQEIGKSILFMIESNPGPGLGGYLGLRFLQAGVLAEEFQQEGGDKEADCGGWRRRTSSSAVPP